MHKWCVQYRTLAGGVWGVLTLDDKRNRAPVDLVTAADLVSDLIRNSSRRLSCHRQERKIKQLFRGLPETIHWKVRPKRVDLYEGLVMESGLLVEQHAHVAICQSSGDQYYWRNSDEPHGPQNYFR